MFSPNLHFRFVVMLDIYSSHSNIYIYIYLQRFSNVVLREETSPDSAVNFIRINDFIKFSSSRDFANAVILKSNLSWLQKHNDETLCARGRWDREVDRIVYVLNIYGTTKSEEGGHFRLNNSLINSPVKHGS